jgi:hypothetical protein
MSEGGNTMSDALLMQYVHDELSPAERVRIDDEIERTPALAERVRVLRHRTGRLSAMLGSLDPAPAEVRASADVIRPVVETSGIITHERWWRLTTPGLRAAAAVFVLIGGVLLVPPARAWVVDQARAVAAAAGLIDDAVVPDSGAQRGGAPEGAAIRVSFPWSSTVLEVAADEARGVLLVVVGTGGAVTAETVGSASTFMVTPAGIRIDGTGDANAVHTVVLPPIVQHLRLLRDGLTIEHRVPAAGDTLRIPLR